MSKSLSKSRFIELKESSDCSQVILSDICDVVTKGTTPTTLGEQFTSDGVNFVKIESISENGEMLSEKFAHISDNCNELLKRSQLKENDILFSIAGAIGRVAIVKKDILPANTNQALAIIRLKNSEDYDIKYITYILRSSDTARQFLSLKRGVAQVNLSLQDIKNLKIDLPSIDIQNQFIRFSDQIDKSKFILQKMIEKLELLKKSRFVEMFGNIKETIPLENCCSLISDFVASGSFASLRDNVKYYDKENYAVLVRTIDFANNFSKDLVYTDKHGYDFLSKTNLYGGEILLSNIGASIGKVFRVPYLNKPMTLAPNSIVIKPNDNYTNEFLEYFFSIGRGQDELHVMTTATATPKFNKTQLRQVPVPKVSKEIQNDFSCFVKQLDKSKLILQKQLEDLVGETK